MLRSGCLSFPFSTPTRSVLCPLHSPAWLSRSCFSLARPVLPEVVRPASARVPGPLAGGCWLSSGILSTPWCFWAAAFLGVESEVRWKTRPGRSLGPKVAGLLSASFMCFRHSVRGFLLLHLATGSREHRPPPASCTRAAPGSHALGARSAPPRRWALGDAALGGWFGSSPGARH